MKIADDHLNGYINKNIVDKIPCFIMGLSFEEDHILKIVKVLGKSVDYLRRLIVVFVSGLIIRFFFILGFCLVFFSIVSRVFDYLKYKTGGRFTFGPVLHFIGFKCSEVVKLSFLWKGALGFGAEIGYFIESRKSLFE